MPTPIWSPLDFLRALFPSRSAAGDMAERWTRAFRADPDLRGDLIRLGGILSAQPVTLDQGVPILDPLDPNRLAYEAGRRDLALALLAAGNLDTHDLNSLMDPDNG